MENVDIKAVRKALQRFIEGRQERHIPSQPNDDDMLLRRALDELQFIRDMNDLYVNELKNQAIGSNKRGC